MTVRFTKVELCSHEWRTMRGGKREQCTRCRTFFPCKGNCQHGDCADARETGVL